MRQRRFGNQRLNLSEQWSSTLHRDRYCRARHRFGMLRGKKTRRIGHLHDPGVNHLKASDFISRTEPVLGRTNHPKAGVAITVECQHDVNQMLQQPRASHRPVLGHVSDDDHCHAAPLGDSNQRTCHFSDLRDAARGSIGLSRTNGLNRIEHHEGRLNLVDVPENGCQIGLGCQIELISYGIGAARAESDLGGRFLARDIQGGMSLACPAGRDLKQQGGLSDAGLAREEHHHARYQAVAEHAVKLGYAGASMSRQLGADAADRHSFRRRHR